MRKLTRPLERQKARATVADRTTRIDYSLHNDGLCKPCMLEGATLRVVKATGFCHECKKHEGKEEKATRIASMVLRNGQAGITELCDSCARRIEAHFSGARPLPHSYDDTCKVAIGDDALLMLTRRKGSP